MPLTKEKPLFRCAIAGCMCAKYPLLSSDIPPAFPAFPRTLFGWNDYAWVCVILSMYWLTVWPRHENSPSRSLRSFFQARVFWCCMREVTQSELVLRAGVLVKKVGQMCRVASNMESLRVGLPRRKAGKFVCVFIPRRKPPSPIYLLISLVTKCITIKRREEWLFTWNFYFFFSLACSGIRSPIRGCYFQDGPYNLFPAIFCQKHSSAGSHYRNRVVKMVIWRRQKLSFWHWLFVGELISIWGHVWKIIERRKQWMLSHGKYVLVRASIGGIEYERGEA